MFVEDYTRYSLLSQNNNSPWNLDKTTVLLITVLTLPVIIFCIAYVTLFGVYDKISYPHANTFKDIPEQWVHRATLYNTYTNNNNNVSRDFYLHKLRDNILTTTKYNIICYYNIPLNPEALQVEDLDPFLCSHINVAFVNVINNSIYLDAKVDNVLKNFSKLKSSNSNLKILLSVGGAGGGSGFSEMVSNHSNRKTFIKSVLYYVKTYGVDGIDLDWEFPNEEPGADKRQKQHFTQLLEELRMTINRQEKYKFLVSVAVAAPTTIIDNSYDVSYMNDFVDFINLMSYDYHYFTKFTPFTGINSPLYASDNENYYLATLNINYSTNYWVYLGMEREKIMVGLPTYGHSFQLLNSANNGLYAPSSGYGKLGSNGFADYSQICSFLTANQVKPIFDMESKSPYATKFNEWISFDDSESLTYKTEYIRNNKFGGVMIYSLNSDDHRGLCKFQSVTNEVKFPLTRTIKQVLLDLQLTP